MTEKSRKEDAMTQTITLDDAELDEIRQQATTGPPGGADPLIARLIGALFLAGFLLYGAGSALVSSLTSNPDVLQTLAAHRTVLALGAFLMFLNTAVDDRSERGSRDFPTIR
jgi:hypothetical protein